MRCLDQPVIDYVDATAAWPLSFHGWQVAWLGTLTGLLLTLAARNWRARSRSRVQVSAAVRVMRAARELRGRRGRGRAGESARSMWKSKRSRE